MARALRIWAVLLAAAAAALALSLASGSAPLPDATWWQVLRAPDGGAASEIVHTLRLPRALAAMATGALLALAGALMQVLLRNPLADPYVLGVSGGAAVGALAALWIGLAAWAVQGAALAGALASIGLVFAIAQRDLARLAAAGTHDAAPRLLLTGVMLAAAWAALLLLMLSLAPPDRLRGMLFWLAGDLSGGQGGGLALAGAALLLALAWPLARDLNVMLRGGAAALTLGVRVRFVRSVLFVLASAAAALAVTTAGAVGFVGLVVPHALRLVIGNDQRVLLPSCVLAGAAALLLADTAARTLAAPQQLPVGVISALVGVPVFLVLLWRQGSLR